MEDEDGTFGFSIAVRMSRSEVLGEKLVCDVIRRVQVKRVAYVTTFELVREACVDDDATRNVVTIIAIENVCEDGGSDGFESVRAANGRQDVSVDRVTNQVRTLRQFVDGALNFRFR